MAMHGSISFINKELENIGRVGGSVLALHLIVSNNGVPNGVSYVDRINYVTSLSMIEFPT